MYRKLHMFDVEVDGDVYAESAHEDAGDEVVVSELPGGVPLGMSICYDVRFPELYRMLAMRGAQVLVVPAAFTLATTRDHWEVLLRARAIENQCFVIAPNQIGAHPPGHRAGGRSLIVDPWGLVLVLRARHRDRDRGRSGLRHARERQEPDPGAQPSPARCVRLEALMAASGTAAADKRRVILDAAMRVFARQGFHTCRVSDIADEAGVAYGLVYHYFSSKDEILDTMFLERWNVMLAAIAEADRTEPAPRDKLRAIAGFIVDSYRYEPDLMKVIVVEVTRAANTFGRTHLEKIREAYAQIAAIVERAQAEGIFRSEISPEFGALAFYGSIEQVLTRWIFDRVAVDEDELEGAKSMIVETICRGLESDREPGGLIGWSAAPDGGAFAGAASMSD